MIVFGGPLRLGDAATDCGARNGAGRRPVAEKIILVIFLIPFAGPARAATHCREQLLCRSIEEGLLVVEQPSDRLSLPPQR